MSPRSTSVNEKIRSDSTRKILDAAFQLMAKNGYDSTSIAQIAKNAGVSKGLMYNYFESKEDLLKTLISGAFIEGEKIMADIISHDASETLQNLFKWFFSELRERPEYWRLITQLTLQIDKFEFVQEFAKNKMKDYVIFLSGLLAQIGIQYPKQEAQLIAGLFDGIAMQYLVIKKDYPLDEMELYLIEKYCST
jgi:AcrR family transcriptional regulator